jgi:hypothetical protein
MYVSPGLSQVLMDGAPQWKCDSIATKIVIPAWVTKLTWASFEEPSNVQEIAFEPGSQLRELELSALATCESLKSICIPASVEVILSNSAYDDVDVVLTGVKSITFEPGSRLREIQKLSFCGFGSLRSICLPASVESLDGGAFLGAGLNDICVARGNRFFRVSGPFLLDFAGVCIVRYFGDGNEVVIANEIETIGPYSFASRTVSAVRFDSTSKVSEIGIWAFSFCGPLQSISIPSSVTVLGGCCLFRCRSLQVVSFEADSRLMIIGAHALEQCHALKSIVLPSRLEIINECAFADCSELETVIFAHGAKLVRIGEAAFAHCFCLESLSLPPLLEFIGENCFYHCTRFSILLFSVPSHLRELLDVPTLWTGFQAIPDSVEILHVSGSGHGKDACTLTFGHESRLREVKMSPGIVGGRFQLSVAEFRYFLRATSRSVKLFRSHLEFSESNAE